MPCVLDIKSGPPQRWIRYQLAGYKLLVEENFNRTEGVLKPSEVEFDPVTHAYKIRGSRVPSVTQALDSVGLSESSPYVSDEALWWGEQVHRMVELFHVDRLDEDALDPLLWPRLEGYKKFVDDYGFVHLAGEIPLGSRKYGFSGKPDLVGFTKIDQAEKSAHFRRYSVHLMDDAKYVVIAYDNHSDENVLLHAVAVEQEKLRIGLSK